MFLDELSCYLFEVLTLPQNQFLFPVLRNVDVNDQVLIRSHSPWWVRVIVFVRRNTTHRL